MFFISKKDTFYGVAIWGGIAVVSLTMIFPSFFTLSISNLVVLLLGVIIVGWLIWIWFSTRYIVDNNTLKIQAGPLKQIVNIQNIKKITNEKSILTAATLSIDRMVIHHGNFEYARVSPKKDDEFIKLLLSKNPQIQIDLSKPYKV